MAESTRIPNDVKEFAFICVKKENREFKESTNVFISIKKKQARMHNKGEKGKIVQWEWVLFRSSWFEEHTIPALSRFIPHPTACI